MHLFFWPEHKLHNTTLSASEKDPQVFAAILQTILVATTLNLLESPKTHRLQKTEPNNKLASEIKRSPITDSALNWKANAFSFSWRQEIRKAIGENGARLDAIGQWHDQKTNKLVNCATREASVRCGDQRLLRNWGLEEFTASDFWVTLN